MAPTGFRLGEFVVEPGTDRLLGQAAGARIELEPKTMAVLLVLAEHAGRVVSSDELIHLVWHDRPMGENPVYKAVAKLRRALHDETDEPRYIETIPRKGYRLLVAPAPLTPASAAGRVADPLPDAVSRTATQMTPNVHRVSRLAMAGLALVVAGVGIASVDRAQRARPEAAPHEVTTARPTRAPTVDPALAALPFEARQAYLLARSELQDRHLGFARRMRRDAEDLIAVAPSFAAGHALRSIACTFRAVHANDPAAVAPAIDGVEALECARQSSQRALQLDPGSAEALSAAGFLAWVDSQQCRSPCDQRGLQDSAQASLEQAVRRDPSLPEAHTWLGMAYQSRGDLLQAAGQAEAALAFDPLNPVATYNANVFLMARGEYAKVRERLVALTRRPDVPPFIVGQLVENALAAGDRDDALHWTGELSRVDGKPSSQWLVAVAYARLERPQAAQAALAAASASTNLETGSDLGYALCAHQLVEGPDGVRAFLRRQQQLRREAPPDSGEEEERWWLEIEGLAYALSGDAERAIPPLERVLGAAGRPRLRLGDVPTEADFANALAWAYIATGRAARGREVAEGTLASLDRVAAMGFDRTPEFALGRALALDLAGHHEQARNEVDRIVTQGRVRRVDLATDPRWRALLDAEAVAVANAGLP